jgi:hypothetical protein
MEEPAKPSKANTSSNLITYGISICGLAGILWLFHMTYAAINMVIAGKGLETYRTFWLVQFNWYGFLAFIMACAIAIAICLWLRWHEHMQWKSLQKKYGRRKRTPN